MRMAGQGQKVDELVTTMNRSAEAAVPMGKDLLVEAVKSMTVDDAKKILAGGDNAVTNFLPTRPAHPWAKVSARGDRSHTQGEPGQCHNTFQRWGARLAMAGVVEGAASQHQKPM